METEYCPPTWEAAMRIYTRCITMGTDERAKLGAIEDLIRAGKLLDECQEELKEAKEEIVKLKKEIT